MVISYLGKSFVKITQGDLTIAVNPIGKDGAWPSKATKFASSVALSSLNDESYNGFDTVTYNDVAPFSISGPGDYEVKDVTIRGVGSKVTRDGDTLINTSYTIIVDGITLAFLGPTQNELDADSRQALMNPDVLFVPIGGGDMLDATKAYKLAVSLEPLIIIPLEWDSKANPDGSRDARSGDAGFRDGDAALKKFLKEAGEEGVAPVDKLTLKRKDLDGKEGDVIVLSYT